MKKRVLQLLKPCLRGGELLVLLLPRRVVLERLVCMGGLSERALEDKTLEEPIDTQHIARHVVHKHRQVVGTGGVIS